ncbi:hypothetical protein PMN64_12475 [Bradyrhizobium sp. UFLA01-814]|uniref:hypothetical protein n=1 Tax=Bradyrhizobium sp. UFLA01-814 TaxID=3023480 RepID=UPI00398AB00C
MFELYPEIATFAHFSDEVPKPTVIVRRDGALKPKEPSFHVRDATTDAKSGERQGGHATAALAAMAEA